MDHMRIAMFTETFLPHIDGVVTRLVHTIEELRGAGDDMLILAPRQRNLPGEYCGARVVGTPSLPLPVYRELRLGLPLTAGIDVELDRFEPDVIHVVNPAVLGLAGLSYARRRGTPLVASYHTHVAPYARRYGLGFLEPALWSYMRWLHNQAGLNLCTSHPVLSQLRAQGFERLEVWAPGVDSQRFSPDHRSAAMRTRLLGGRTDATLLLYVGRLANEKSVERTAPALASLPDCHLAIVGDGPLRSWLEDVFAGLPVTFVGALHDEDLAAAYASADIFAFPSSTETLGLAAIEAMAAGLPVVGARRGGIPDVVVDGQTGLLFDPDAPGDFAAALGQLSTNGPLRLRMGEAARRRAEVWTWEASTAGLRGYYQRVITAQRVAANAEGSPDVVAREAAGESAETAADPSSAPSR